MSRAFRLLPIILLVWVLLGFAWRLIQPPDPTVRSQLVNREVPPFVLQPAVDGVPGLTSADLATGEPRLLNLFGSWCVPCIGEAPRARGASAQGSEDRRDRHSRYSRAAFPRSSDVTETLTRESGATRTVAFSSLWGQSGVPETFVVDGKGVIRRQYVGPIGRSDVPKIIAELEELR